MPRGNRHFLPGQVWHITKSLPSAGIPAEILAGSATLSSLAIRVVAFCRADSISGQTQVINGGIVFH